MTSLPADLDWSDTSGDQLTAAALHEILALRNRVFVVEQACPYQDIDGLDLSPTTRHLCAHNGDDLAAYARVLGPAPEAVRIGRVIVSSALRGQRVGHELMSKSLASALTHWPAAPITLAAQAHLEAYYATHGFVSVGPAYDEDGIPHLDMVHQPA